MTPRYPTTSFSLKQHLKINIFKHIQSQILDFPNPNLSFS